MKTFQFMFIAIAMALLVVACGDTKEKQVGGEHDATVTKTVDLGLASGMNAAVVAEGLMNPSGVSFDPSGHPTICDAGHGRVIKVIDGRITEFITGFDTEYWKVDKKTGDRRYKIGPINAVWLPDGRVVVSDSGKKDSKDRLMFFENGGAVGAGFATNGIPKTSDDPADLGEGNPTGLALSHDKKSVWVASQGADAKTWITSCDIEAEKLSTWASADDNGIAINSPMQILVWDEGHILCIYSGKGGAEDGLIVKWNVATKKPVQQWTLPGLLDPMGMDRIPGTDELAVVDCKWALTKVNEGSLARVTLGTGPAATVKVLGTKLLGPVACAFGPDQKLYVCLLGAEFDKTEGSVVSISGFDS